MAKRTYRSTGFVFLSGIAALVIVAVFGATVIAVLESGDAELNAFYEKVAENRQRALETSEIVLTSSPEDLVTGSDLKESVNWKMQQNFKDGLLCTLGPGTYRKVANKTNDMVEIEFRAPNGSDCTGYYVVTQEFWAFVLTLKG